MNDALCFLKHARTFINMYVNQDDRPHTFISMYVREAMLEKYALKSFAGIAAASGSALYLYLKAHM